MADTEAVTKSDLAALEARTLERTEAAKLEMLERIEAAKLEMLERMERIETSLLTAFQVWAVPVNGRLRKLELGDANLGERLAAIEDRLMALERRPGPGSSPSSAH